MRYCDVCQEERDYAVCERRMHGYINGRRVEYIGLKAYCKMCGAEILVPQLAELNEHFLLQAYHVWRTMSAVGRDTPEPIRSGRRVRPSQDSGG